MLFTHCRWIPDGQLCPTVPNRSNYIHWINDLLSSEIIQSLGGEGRSKVKGFDIGTGANCIYPLLGASLFCWSFVGSGFFFFFKHNPFAVYNMASIVVYMHSQLGANVVVSRCYCRSFRMGREECQN